jgi:hypothetical protein
MTAIFNKVLAIIQHIGYLYFALLILADIILWKIHPVLGILGVAFTFALLLGII